MKRGCPFEWVLIGLLDYHFGMLGDDGGRPQEN